MAASTEDRTDQVPSLLSFRPTFDFRKFVEEHMLVEKSQEANDIISRSARIVGQENDGSLLIVWDAPHNAKIATHVGIYHPSMPSYRTLFTHETQVNIFGATVDHYRSLLAFTIYEELVNGPNYDTLVAEINPCNRVFSLNLSSPDFRKLQFIQPTATPTASTHKRSHGKQQLKSSLLVIIPNNWICLYSFQLEPFHKGYTVVSQPAQDVITENVPWYQWDSKLQWLCYARFGTLPTETKRLGKGNVTTECSVVLLIVTFEEGTHKVLLTIALPTPYQHTKYIQESTYFKSHLALNLPVYELNMKVLHNHDGIWCVCLQHKSPSKDPKLEYSVYILHNGHVIDNETILSDDSLSSSHNNYINFFLVGNFVVAYIPNVMLHILNISTHTDPCHHIILDGKYSPSLPKTTLGENQDQQIITSAVPFKYDVDISAPVFDTRSQSLYTFQLEPSEFLGLFKECPVLDLRLSLLHVMIIGIQQYSTALEMIEYICQSPLSLDDPKLFQEFIIALTYSNMLAESPPLFCKLLPLTTSLVYGGKIYKNSQGVKFAILRCTELPNFVKQLLVQSDQKLVSANNEDMYNYSRVNTDAFGHLCFNCVINQPNFYKRLSLEDIAAQVTTLALSTPILTNNSAKKKSSKQAKMPFAVEDKATTNTVFKSGSFVGKLKDLIQSTRVPSQPEQTMSTLSLPFLLPDEDLSHLLNLHFNLFHDRFLEQMSSNLRLQSKSAINRMIQKSERYLLELNRSSRLLLHIIWVSLNFNNDENHPLKMSIHRQASAEEEIFFELLESFYIAHKDVGITLPSGFATLFVCMGYMCLEPSVFIQYLCNGVFIPTARFLELLFMNCENVHEDFLFEIVSNLSYDMQEVAFALWKNPLLQQMITNDNPSANVAQTQK